jgi:hypothetical protein
MNTEELFDAACASIRDAAGDGCVSCELMDRLINGLRDAQRALWAVRVLDESALLLAAALHVNGDIAPDFGAYPIGETARIDIARSVFARLPDASRTKLGACP